ncbi:hypothetical protein [Streptomyces sp. NBC_01257]|uniref:hypothetical protein n=1 Tax=Streptomyces sp. NBC_01257 TaxID=2903799 RepID=UPI002DDAEB9E|nr:hypothetical protein [Streptomyces sp. NBC_01257]WRZ70154.1 FBP domain-containing protein [Streptomyces sp. NBC_01257]
MIRRRSCTGGRHVRGKKAVTSGARFKESLTVEEQIDRTKANLSAYVAKLFG